MAFTSWEFFRGAVVAWLWFLLLSTIGFLPFTATLGVVSALAFTQAWVVCVLASTIAVPLGWASGSKHARGARRAALARHPMIASDAADPLEN